MSENWRRAGPLLAAVLAADQAAKWWMERLLEPGETLALLPFLALRLAYNTGAAFSFLHDAGGWQRGFLLAATAGIMAWLAWWTHRLAPDERALAWPLGLLLGGAAGNLVDRAASGAVVDFVVLHYGGWAWPTFNLADAAITVGVAGLLWLGLRRPGRRA